jgi:adenosylcobinamide-GDP ribazoletransferase
MLFVLTFGKPAAANSSSVPFVRSLKGLRRMVGASLALVGPPLCLLPLGGFAPLAALSVPLTSLGVLQMARRTFGGIGGDVVGATGELARGVLLVFLSAIQ